MSNFLLGALSAASSLLGLNPGDGSDSTGDRKSPSGTVNSVDTVLAEYPDLSPAECEQIKNALGGAPALAAQCAQEMASSRGATSGSPPKSVLDLATLIRDQGDEALANKLTQNWGTYSSPSRAPVSLSAQQAGSVDSVEADPGLVSTVNNHRATVTV